MRKELIFELIAIGILAVLFDLVIYKLLSGYFPSPSLPYYNKMILGAFLLGASLHFVLEVVGVNESWCNSVFKKK